MKTTVTITKKMLLELVDEHLATKNLQAASTYRFGFKIHEHSLGPYDSHQTVELLTLSVEVIPKPAK